MPSNSSYALTPLLTEGAPAPGGHYSQGVVAGDHIYISGQLPIGADGTHNAEATFEEQARLVIRHMLAVLEAGGGSVSTLARVTAYIVGTDNWPVFNRVYAEMLGDTRPARTVVPVPALHYGYLVELDAIGVLVK